MTGETQAAEVGGLEEVLAAHQRVRGPRDVPSLDIHCACGWTHPDRFVSNPDIHRAHVAAAVRTWLNTALTRPEVVEAAQQGVLDAAMTRPPINDHLALYAPAALAAAVQALGSRA